MKTNKLQTAINETQYTNEEWKAHKKVEKNCHLCDILDELNSKLEQEEITKEQYEDLCNNYDTILYYFEENLTNTDDWWYALNNAINDMLEE